MSFPSKRLLVAGLFGAVVLFHLAVAGQDFGVLAENGFLYDDSFYAFKIAENIADGRGASFDGVHPTNGFQPLYVFLLVPFYWWFRSDLIGPVYAALAISAVLTALTALLLFLIVRRYTSTRIAVLTSAIWAFSPVVTKQSANGLETALALFLFASIVYFYLSRIRSEAAPSRRSFLALGLLFGLAVLSRIDEVFLVLVVVLDYLFVLRKRRATSGELKGLFVAVAAALITYAPWLLYNAIVIGSLYQESGAATRYLSLAYAPFFGLGSPEMASTGPTLGFLWGHVVHSFSVLKVSPPVHPFFRGVEKLGAELGAGRTPMLVANACGLVFLSAFVYLVVVRKKHLLVRGFHEAQFLLVFSAAIIVAYSFYVFGVFFFARYYYPVYFVLCLYGGFLVEEGSRRFPSGVRAVRAFATGVLAVYLCGFAYMAYSCAHRSHHVYCFYEMARWVNENTSRDDTIGVFQSGAIGYFAERRVVNLDGKVNRAALEALRNGDVGDYLRKEGIDVVMDNRNVLELFLTGKVDGNRSDDPLVLLGLHPMMEGGIAGVREWAAYRVNGFASAH